MEYTDSTVEPYPATGSTCCMAGDDGLFILNRKVSRV